MVGENSCHGNNPQSPQEHFPSARENTSAAREASEMGTLSAQAERGTALLATDQTELETSVTEQEAIVSTANNTIPTETALLPTYTPPKKYSATLPPVLEGAIEEEQIEQTISYLAKICREKALLNESDVLFADFYTTSTATCDRAAREMAITDDLQVRYLCYNVLTRVQNAETMINDSIMNSREAFTLLEIATASSKATEAIADKKDQIVIDLYIQTKACREKALDKPATLKEFHTIAAEACDRAAEVMAATDHL